ncbi:zincin-like metallopeptidase domain-containing protein [Methylorubrum sp. SB2]|uniref:zincin-like metallopeptidase domain-containing protein n=1 Tax=Methylorubrum subtropicum TaxID=3138812 RepID=UPI00313B8241
MGDFYQVIKTIKGRPYRYKQRTFRVGGKVCTESHYLGPATEAEAARIRADMALRKGGPSRPAVRRAIARLADPAAAGSRWRKPWDNSSPRRQKVRRIEALQRIIASSGAFVNETDAAYYDWTNDQLGLPPQARFHRVDGGDADQEFYHVALHELAHWTGHRTRLKRTIPDPTMARYKTIYSQEELIAEATAVIVAEHFGLASQALGLHEHYFQHFLSNMPDPAEALVKTEREAHRAACFLIGRANTTLASHDRMSP